SACTKSARPPAARISATALLPRSASRPAITTYAPRLASRSATARPIPLFPPVTKAVRPAKSWDIACSPSTSWSNCSNSCREILEYQVQNLYSGGVTTSDHRLTKKGQATRDRIVAAASQLMLEQGVARTTIEDIQAAAGVRASQLYHYFAGKDALV